MSTTATAAPRTTTRHALTLEVRAATDTDTDDRTFTGLAVPWDTEIELWPGVREKFARGSIEPRETVKVFWRHGEVIGLVTEYEDTDAGWQITGRISATSTGDEAYTLLRDGVIDRLSIGFEPIEYDLDDEHQLTTHTRARVHEVSLVPIPAYEDARITQVRHATPPPEGTTVTTTTESPALTDAEVRQMLTETERRLAVQISDAVSAAPSGGSIDERSAGQLIKDALAGDESAVAVLNAGQAAAFDTRSYAHVARVIGRDAGTPPVTSAAGGSTLKPAWVGDMTRLIDEAAGIRGVFGEGALPSTGKHIEYGVLGTDASAVSQQANEGDDLIYGEVTLDSETAPVLTFGGYTQLTRQAIERSTAPLLDANLRGQAIAANRYLNTAFRAAYDTLRGAQTTAGNTVDVPATATWADWVSGIVDAAEKYEDLGLSLDGLIVDKAAFKELAALEGSDGRPLLTLTGNGTNVVGSLNAPALTGNLAGVPVILNAKQAAAGQAFFNRDALRTYRSPLVRLQDSNVINLTEAFSIYGYVAFAAEIPAAVVPVARA